MLDRAQLDNELTGAHQANFVRYAIYYTPLPGSPLSAFAPLASNYPVFEISSAGQP